MKHSKATSLIAIFLVENEFSFAELSMALKRSITTPKSISVPGEWKK
jgi:hypothetical protein